jgi:hypothetical protein
VTYTFKNPDLIHSNELINENTREIVIKRYSSDSGTRETKLSDVLIALPSGVIYKDETGMGATHLEMITPRNSIIVEPIKITASSKADNRDIKCLYVGGPTSLHPQKITNSAIVQYLTDTTIQYKKILVVADSLSKVIKALKEINATDYFLLIDEVDSFQLDSTFRKSMEDCIDEYKDFPKEQRALLSATVMEFSDQSLFEEPVTILKYNSQVGRIINLILSHKTVIQGACISVVENLLQNNPNDKILVAYNSVSGAFNIATNLINSNLNRTDVSILCSQNSRTKVGDLYKELSSDFLPTKLNFCTSAYFTGFDLNEKYHLVTVTSVLSKVHALSEKRMKQIAGRARLGLLSETIIQDFEEKEDIVLTKEICLSAAETEIQVLKCIKRQFADNFLLQNNYQKISNLILDSLEYEGKKYLRNTNTDNPKISYFNIDAAIENSYVLHHLYQEPLTLYNVLQSAGHSVTKTHDIQYRTIESVNIDQVDRVNRINEILDILIGIDSEDQLGELELRRREFSDIQLKLLDFFKKMIGYIEKENFINTLRETAVLKDSRRLNNYILSATFLTDASGELFKSRVERYFQVNQKYSDADLANLWKAIFTETNILRREFSHVSAVRLTKVFFKLKSSRTTKLFTILRTNPYDINVIKVKEEADAISATIRLVSSLFTT